MKIPLTPIRFLERARQQFGRKVGVIDGDLRFTYQEYASRCRRLAGLIQSWGLPAATPAAVMSYNTHALLECYYGVPMAGHVLLPLNIRLNAQDFVFILNDSETSALFFHSDFLETVQEIRKSLKTTRRFVMLDKGPRPDWVESGGYDELLLLQEEGACVDWTQIDEDSIAEMFYTSGTTGNPKGVQLTHRNLYLHGLEAALAVACQDKDVILHTIPLFHVNGWGAPQYLTGLGGTHVMLEKFEAPACFEAIQRHGVTAFSVVPTMATTLLNCPDRHQYDFSSLRLINIGGAASNIHLIRAMEELFGCDVVAGYGLTETSPVLTLAWPRTHLDLNDERRIEVQACTGCPVPGTELAIWDEEGSPLPWDGQSVGEIVVRGDMVMAGYYNRDEENKAAFQGGWFHTGDMASIDSNGYVTIVDRSKDIIISGGENISSLAVEKAMLGHPAILECAVIAVPDEIWGEVPKALVVLKDGAQAGERELVEYGRRHLAHFMAPKSVDFYDSFPKGGTGKILKRELRETYWTGQRKRVH